MAINNFIETTEIPRYPQTSVAFASIKRFSQYVEISSPELIAAISEEATNEFNLNSDKSSTDVQRYSQTVDKSRKPGTLSPSTTQPTTITAERVTTENIIGSDSQSSDIQINEISTEMNEGISVEQDTTKMFYDSNESTELKMPQYGATSSAIMELSKYTESNNFNNFLDKSTIGTSWRTVSQKGIQQEGCDMLTSSNRNDAADSNVTAKYLISAQSGGGTIDEHSNTATIRYMSSESSEGKSSNTLDKINHSDISSQTLKYPHMSHHAVMMTACSNDETTTSSTTSQTIDTTRNDLASSTAKSQTYQSDRQQLTETIMEANSAMSGGMSIDAGFSEAVRPSASDNTKYISSLEDESATPAHSHISEAFDTSLSQPSTWTLSNDLYAQTVKSNTQTPHPTTHSTSIFNNVNISRSSNAGNATIPGSFDAVSGHISESSNLKFSSESRVSQMALVSDETETIEHHRTTPTFQSTEQPRDSAAITMATTLLQHSQLSTNASSPLMTLPSHQHHPLVNMCPLQWIEDWICRVTCKL